MYAKVIVVLVVCISMFYPVYAEIERCSKCGTVLMKGTYHSCSARGLNKVNKERRMAERRAARVTIKQKEADKEVKEEVKSPKSNLPEFKFKKNYRRSYVRYDVIGVCIDPTKNKPQLVCKNQSSKEDELFDIDEFDVANYYSNNVARIPVLGVKGVRPNTTIEDETQRIAVERLKQARDNARQKLKEEQANQREKLKEELEQARKNYREYRTPLKCLAAQALFPDGTRMLRRWKKKEGEELEGAWVGNYDQFNIKGIVILDNENKKLHKWPLQMLCDEDLDYVRREPEDSGVPRPELRTISIPKQSPLYERFKSATGVNIKNIEGVEFAKGYIQLYPAGQICELPIECKESYGATQDDAAKGPVFLLEKRYVEIAEEKKRAEIAAAEAAAAKATEKKRAEIAAAEAAAAREEERKRAEMELAERLRKIERERPYREEYKRICSSLNVAIGSMELCNPEKHCDVHKWKEQYATEEQRAAYANNYMKAIELLDKGLMKCTCSDKYWRDKYNEVWKKMREASEQKNRLIIEHPDIDFTR